MKRLPGGRALLKRVMNISTMEMNRSAAVGGVGNVVAILFPMLSVWNDARMSRRELNSLSDHKLNDIGLARGDIGRIARGC
jgi:uncharacterized protein YjiS (DUF1127 family)